MKTNLPATKDDLQKAVAKLATKDDLKRFAAKDDLKKFATKKELGAVEKRLDNRINSVEKRLNDKIDGVERSIRAGTRLDIDERTKELEEKINLLPTKNEFFTQMDKLMKELEIIREEHTVSDYQSKNYGERLTILEQKTGVATI